MKNNKIKTSLAILSLGGTLVIGTAIGRPDCDYVIYDADKEVCLSVEQVEEIEQILQGSVGFGGVKLGGGINLKNVLEMRKLEKSLEEK